MRVGGPQAGNKHVAHVEISVSLDCHLNHVVQESLGVIKTNLIEF